MRMITSSHATVLLGGRFSPTRRAIAKIARIKPPTVRRWVWRLVPTASVIWGSMGESVRGSG
jgi:hypothetical protein